MNSPNQIVVKNYTGSSESATEEFKADSVRMGNQGYYPISQSWTPGSYGCGSFIVALLLCVILIGFLVFIYMLIVKPEGTLTVTYEYRARANKEASKDELNFSGRPELSNDSYVLYLSKKFDIQKNDVLGKYVLREKLYDTIEQALGAGHDLRNQEVEARKAELELSKKNLEDAAVRLAEFQRVSKEKARVRKILIWKITLVAIPLIMFGLLAKKFFVDDGVAAADSKPISAQTAKKK